MVVCPMAMGLMEKLGLTNPAGIVTLAGTVAMAGLEDERATLIELPTAALIVAVIVAVLGWRPALCGFGGSGTVSGGGGIAALTRVREITPPPVGDSFVLSPPVG